MEHTYYHRLEDMMSITTRYRFVSLFLVVFLTSLFPIGVDTVLSNELTIHVVEPSPREDTAITRPNQLPLSRLAHGHRNIITTWLAGPTDRYRQSLQFRRFFLQQLSSPVVTPPTALISSTKASGELLLNNRVVAQ